MFLALSLAAATLSQPRINTQIDPIDDTKSVYVIVGTPSAYLALGCQNVADRSTIRVVAKFDRYVGDGVPGLIAGGTVLQYRFDQRPASTVRWYSHDREVTAEAARTSPIKFMLEMKGSTRAYLRAQNYDADPVGMALNYEDPTVLIEEVLTQCGFNADGTVAN